jgi:hypothetical protein
MDLATAVLIIELRHGGLRQAARATGVDVAYLKRLRDGEKENPSESTLKKLRLKKVISYVEI